jgi:hypothetical protein
MRALPILTLLLILGLGWSAEGAEPELTLKLASGREFRGAIDGGSTDEVLVLRSSRGGMTIRRPIRWEKIVAAMIDGTATTVDELRAMAEEAREEVGSRRSEVENRGQETGDRGQGPEGSQAASIAFVETLPLVPVTTIGFDARLANWDSDVETDGLVVDLFPIDAEAYLAAVDGTVEVELFAPQRRAFHHAPLSGGDTIELVERWTQSVHPPDFTGNGVRMRLPFGVVHPEFDFDWVASSYGLVHVRLVAPGHGVFDASQDGIRIRPFAPNRDRLELQENRRFLPTERVGRRD